MIDRHRHAEIGQRQLVLAQKVDAEGVVVDGHELIGFFERAGLHLEGRKAADRYRAVERPFDVVGGDRGAVVELGVACAA